MPDDKNAAIRPEQPASRRGPENQEAGALAPEKPETAPTRPAKQEIPVKVYNPEKAEKRDKPAGQTFERPGQTAGQSALPPAAASAGPDPARQRRIEAVMAKGLEEEYARLPADKKLAFKQKGEATAARINLLISQGKATMKKIVDLVKDWLMLLPGVNRFFLEQEAKIKADEIMALKDISNFK